MEQLIEKKQEAPGTLADARKDGEFCQKLRVSVHEFVCKMLENEDASVERSKAVDKRLRQIGRMIIDGKQPDPDFIKEAKAMDSRKFDGVHRDGELEREAIAVMQRTCRELSPDLERNVHFTELDDFFRSLVSELKQQLRISRMLERGARSVQAKMSQ